MRLVVTDFRGIREGCVELKRLNILLGPNNSGKSAILEGLFLLPNPMRQVPYATPTSPAGILAVELLSHVHETLGSRAFISLFHNYNANTVSISLVDDRVRTRVQFQRVNDRIEVYLEDEEAYYVGSMSASSTRMMEEHNVMRAVYDEKTHTYKGQGAYLDVQTRYFVSRIGEALYLHPMLVKLAWNYLRMHWVKLRGSGILSVIAKRLSESIGGDYDDVLLEPFTGGQQTVYVRTRDGRGIRLGDLGDGAQVYLTLMLLYEYVRPKMLLVDDVESHMNPYVLVHVASWLDKVLEQGVIVVLTTHSIEAAKIIAHTLIDYEPQITVLSLRNGILKSMNMSISEVEELEEKGLDVRAIGGVVV